MKYDELYEITSTEDYKNYIAALCRLASNYVPSIRRQFAEKALENFKNETLRTLVIAYGEEMKKLDADRMREFEWAVKYPEHESRLEDSCLNKAAHFEATIKFFYLDK